MPDFQGLKDAYTQEQVSARKRFLFLIRGESALFPDPLTKRSGNRISYETPTYSAMRGTLMAWYWKPSVEWRIRRVRVLERIISSAVGYSGESGCGERVQRSDLVLNNVKYIVEADLIYNLEQIEMRNDWIIGKHRDLVLRRSDKSGVMTPYLGVSEHVASVCLITDKDNKNMKGYYDKSGKLEFGRQFHSFRLLGDNPAVGAVRKEEIPKRISGLPSNIDTERMRCGTWWENQTMTDGVVIYPQYGDESLHTQYIRQMTGKELSKAILKNKKG